MDKVIDIQNWTRKEEYLFFRTFLNPMISVTVEVDCTTAYRKAKERQQPFSLYYMHAAVTAANRIEEFRYRQVGEEVILMNESIYLRLYKMLTAVIVLSVCLR